jgi:hypothetical protein
MAKKGAPYYCMYKRRGKLKGEIKMSWKTVDKIKQIVPNHVKDLKAWFWDEEKQMAFDEDIIFFAVVGTEDEEIEHCEEWTEKQYNDFIRPMTIQSNGDISDPALAKNFLAVVVGGEGSDFSEEVAAMKKREEDSHRFENMYKRKKEKAEE